MNNPWTSYEKRIRRVTDYIHAHLDDPLDLDRLAEIACLSAYHWHRIYRAIVGETPAMTVKRLRLHRAAGELVGSDLPISAIARACGYPNVQSFTRIFRSDYGMPPATYRKRGLLTARLSRASTGENQMYEVEIRYIASMKAVGVDHTGSYMEINKAFTALSVELAARGLMGHVDLMLGVYFDDPDTIAESKLKSAACVVLRNGVEVPGSFSQYDLPGGNYAVLKHKGPYAGLRDAYRYLYANWLRTSNVEVRDAPVFEIYVNNPRDVPASELLTEICVPLV